VRGHLIHIDLQEVRLDQPIQAQVVVELVGDPEGVKEGGVLSQVQREINVEALPLEIPDRLELDVSGMEIGDSLRLADLPPREGVTYLDDPEETVLATVGAPTQIVEPEPEEEELEEGELPEGEVPEGEEAPEGAAEEPAERRRTPANRAPQSPLKRCDCSGGATVPRRSIFWSWGSEPRARARTRPPQRRLDGRRRACAAARRALAVQVLGQLAEVRLDGLRLALLKPETYMNDSGRSVSAATRFFKVEPESLLVVHDDVDLEPGRLQARAGGGLAGHNGMRSLAQALGTQDFLRLRIGVGRPGRGDPRSVADYVLAPFELEEDVGALVSRAADAVETIARDGVEAAQQRFNQTR
jgi:PTH1 family peptidyl-tRNA hydrolase